MLTEEEKREIQEEIKQYPYPAVACIDALKIVQHHRGWVSDESVIDIAHLLNISNEEVDGVATFYSRIYRKPVGRNVILICDSVTCMNHCTSIFQRNLASFSAVPLLMAGSRFCQFHALVIAITRLL